MKANSLDSLAFSESTHLVGTCQLFDDDAITIAVGVERSTGAPMGTIGVGGADVGVA